VRVAAALLAVVGVIWVGQGLGYIKGSFMTGDPRWLRIGFICLAAAVLVGFASFRGRRSA